MVFRQNEIADRKPQPHFVQGDLSTSSSSDTEHATNIDSPFNIQIHVGDSAVFVTHAGTILAREPTSLLARDVKAQSSLTKSPFNQHKQHQQQQIQLSYPNRNPTIFMHILSYMRTGIPDFHKLDSAGLELLENETIFFELCGLRERTIMERERRRKVTVPPRMGKSVSKSETEEAIQEEMWVDDALLQCCRDTDRDKLPVPDDDLIFALVL